MRRFAIIKPETLWTGDGVRMLRAAHAEVRELWTYLLTCPSGNPWGIFRIEIPHISLETGRGEPSVKEAMETLRRLDLLEYDHATCFVYVPGMPETQFTTWPLLPKDHNVKYAKRWYTQLERNPFLSKWWDRHLVDLHLTAEPAVARRTFELLPAPEIPTQLVEPAPSEKGQCPDPAPDPVPAPDPAPPIPTDLLGQRVKDLPAKLRPRLTPKEIDKVFSEIVRMYPKGDAVTLAKRAFEKLRPDSETVAMIFSALKWQVPRYARDNGVYAPRLDRYFEQKRWLDRKPPELERRPRVNQSTVDIMKSAQDFINDEEPPEGWTTPEKPKRALPPPSRRSRS